MSWQVDEQTTLRSSLGTGYRAPSLYERFGPFAAGPLQPEDSLSLDLGVERDLAGRGSVRATLFWSEIDNLIQFASAPTCLPTQSFGCYTQVPGTTLTRGVELLGDYQITDRIELTGSYTLTSAKTAGQRVIRVPRHDLSLGLTADITDRLQMGVGVTHVADTLDGFGAPTPLEDYTVLDLTARYDLSDRTTFFAAIDNVTDTAYQTVRGFNEPERTYRLGIQAKF